MKYHGCTLEFTAERNKQLIQAFRRALAAHKHIEINQIAHEVVNTPCTRFWVSEERAVTVINALIKNKPILRVMRQSKREMFREIYARYRKLRKIHPTLPVKQIVAKIINSPAPKFYMQPRCAIEIIYKLRRQTQKHKFQNGTNHTTK